MKLFKLIVLLVITTTSIGHTQKKDRGEDPIQNFEFLWELFNQNYASFAEKGLNWPTVYEKYRPQISTETTPLELFEILTEMLQPLHDDHVNLIARSLDTGFVASRPSSIMQQLAPLPGRERRKAFNEMVQQTLKRNGFKPMSEAGPTYNGRKLFAFTDNGKIGYLRFTRSFTARKFLHFTALNKLLEEIFFSFKGLQDGGLIVDIRFNMGGDDSFSKKIAGRFVEKKILSYYKQTRKNSRFGSLQPHYLIPKGKSKFFGPIVLLTNDKTVSAADVLALMMSQLPNVTLIGERSNGSFSDLMAKKMPNGWTVTLSNQRYLSLDKMNYEGQGIPVDVSLPNTLKQLQQQEDLAILKALKNLNTKD